MPQSQTAANPDDLFGQEHILSLTGLLTRDKVKPRKMEPPLAVAIPSYRTLMSY